MKRLNRKGFTLVELLAVIVILAIVVGITLVTVLPTLKDSRQEAFNVTAQTAADYFEKQYQLSLIGKNTYTFATGSLVASPTTTTEGVDVKSSLSAAGVKAGNYATAKMYINTTTGRACVIFTASTTGDYKDATGTAKSSGCA